LKNEDFKIIDLGDYQAFNRINLKEINLNISLGLEFIKYKN